MAHPNSDPGLKHDYWSKRNIFIYHRPLNLYKILTYYVENGREMRQLCKKTSDG